MAPELARDNTCYSHFSDVFAVMIVFKQMIDGEIPGCRVESEAALEQVSIFIGQNIPCITFHLHECSIVQTMHLPILTSYR